MTHKTFGNKKLGIEKKLLCRAIIGALTVLPLTIQAQTNFFADMPFQYQKKNLITTSFSVKPNILLYIDNSASMREETIWSCHYFTKIKKVSKNGKISWVWSSKRSAETVGVDSTPSPAGTISPDGMRKYTGCAKTGETKDSLLRPVIRHIVDKYKNDMYFALVPMNNSDEAVYNKFYDTGSDSEYKDFITLLNEYPVRGGTPMHRVYVSIARNLLMNKLRYRCQKSFIVALTDGEARKKDVAESDAGFDNYFYKNKSTNDLANYFDKNPIEALKHFTNILSAENFGPYIYTGNVYRKEGNHLTDEAKKNKLVKRTVDEAGQPWDGDIDNLEHPDAPKQKFTQIAETFTIGFGLGLKHTTKAGNAIPYLENAATPKGEYDKDTNPQGRFYNTNDQNEILDAFENIFKDIKGSITESKVNITASAPALGVSDHRNGKVVTTVKTNTDDWSSVLCIQDLDSLQDGCKQPSFGNSRQLILNDGQNTYLYADSHLSTNSSKSLNNETFKIKNNDGKNQNEWLDGLLTWLGRSKADKDINNSNSNFVLKYRERPTTNLMGDIFSNNISYIGETGSPFQKYMVTSANDGMVYVFKYTDDDTYPYTLKFNYMPMGIERQSNDGSDLVEHYYKDFVQKKYGEDSTQPHRYLMNGQVFLRQTEARKEKDPQLSFMLATMGQAGRGAFAINIGGKNLINGNPIAADDTGSGNWYENVPLFQTPSGEDNEFGYTISKPAIGRLRVNEADPDSVAIANHVREVGFISNGYNYSESLASDNSPQMSNESALYIYDLLGIDVGTDGFQKTGANKGSLIAKIVAPDGIGGLSSPTQIDTDGDGIINYVYAGDYGGNVFRFDLNSADPSKWKATKIFSSGKPITIAPMIYVANIDTNKNGQAINIDKLIIVFGTGSSIYQSDLNNHDQQSLYGIYDDLSKTDGDALVTKSELLKQELSDNSLSDHKLDKSQKGWYINLHDNGERVVSPIDALLYTGFVYTESYKVSTEDLPKDPCKQTTRLQQVITKTGKIQFDARNGGALSKNNPHVLVDSNGDVISATYTDAQISKFLSNGDPAGGLLYPEGTDKPLTPPGPIVTTTCLRKVPKLIENGPKGVTVTDIKGVVMCPVSINRLSWREIKTGYLS
ncbi:PilC/PilY family type IV pilus protein [Snodgrassella alvi]|uniref:PilC/PilY family type IV pilus protein n=1 Tax=Snodgrassella alvi TaxID=1196083 RepID=UPI000A00B580|nr:PilC/PilY family type IV pilus protein [Snodgrassella alvi]ORF41559.1 hypothetical protein BGI12_00390 [Snodgrassella alvi]